MKPTVILFSTHYRTWEHTAQFHLEFINKIADGECVVGIHVWDGPGVPNEPPVPIRGLPHIMTKTSQVPLDEYFSSHLYIMESTREALNNARELYKRQYGIEMPPDTRIVRMRPDAYILDMESAVRATINNTTDNTYVSIWNTAHRPKISIAPEIADVLYVTSCDVLDRLIGLNEKTLETHYAMKKWEGFQLHFHEHFLYHALEYARVVIVFEYNFRLGILRGNMIIDKLTA